jgi:hypothetical protein
MAFDGGPPTGPGSTTGDVGSFCDCSAPRVGPHYGVSCRGRSALAAAGPPTNNSGANSCKHRRQVSHSCAVPGDS